MQQHLNDGTSLPDPSAEAKPPVAQSSAGLQDPSQLAKLISRYWIYPVWLNGVFMYDGMETLPICSTGWNRHQARP